MKKSILIALVSVSLLSLTACSQSNKDEVTDIVQPEYLYFDVIAIDNSASGTVTQGQAVTVKLNP